MRVGPGQLVEVLPRPRREEVDPALVEVSRRLLAEPAAGAARELVGVDPGVPQPLLGVEGPLPCHPSLQYLQVGHELSLLA